MTDKEKILAEVERYKKLIGDPTLNDDDLIIGERNACNHIIKLINSLPEEQDNEIVKEARISIGMLCNYGTSSFVLDIDLTQEEQSRLHLSPIPSGTIKIKIPCE